MLDNRTETGPLTQKVGCRNRDISACRQAFYQFSAEAVLWGDSDCTVTGNIIQSAWVEFLPVGGGAPDLHLHAFDFLFIFQGYFRFVLLVVLRPS